MIQTFPFILFNFILPHSHLATSITYWTIFCNTGLCCFCNTAYLLLDILLCRWCHKYSWKSCEKVDYQTRFLVWLPSLLICPDYILEPRRWLYISLWVQALFSYLPDGSPELSGFPLVCNIIFTIPSVCNFFREVVSHGGVCRLDMPPL